MVRILTLLVALILLPHGICFVSADMVVWSENSLTKIQPATPVKPRPSAIYLSAARNEYEPFQVVVRSIGGALRGVDVDLSDFHGGRGAKISCRENCTIYRELYIRVTTPSGPYGSIGEWPDPLIPKIDRYAGERRNAFPFDVPQDRNQPIWVDVYVPADASPGEYTASLKVQAKAEPTIHIPVQLTVRSFVLPATSSIKTAFLLWGGALPVLHGSEFSGEPLDQLVRLYSSALLLHRLSNGWLLGGQDWQPTELVRANTDDLQKLHANLTPFFDGSITSSGGKVTAVVPPSLMCLGGSYPRETPAFPYVNFSGAFCRPDVIDFLRLAGWLERLAFYLPDEPNLADPKVLGEVNSLVDLFRQRGLRTLITGCGAGATVPNADVWVVPVPVLHQAFQDGTFASTYGQKQSARGEVWVYQACFTHSAACGGQQWYPGSPGWPDYMIDMQGMKNRIQDWINWRLGVQGELYWGVNGAYYEGDPLQTPYFGYGNGEGNFFYPGTPARIGGSSHIPIESIRLKLKREGLEDYEYLALLARLGDRSYADVKAAQIATSAIEWDQDPDHLYSVRSQISDRIESLLSGRSTP